jgi:hypothetical protein
MNIFNQLNTIEYHQNNVDHYRRQLLEMGRNMQIDDDDLEDMLENHYENAPVTLRHYYALIIIYSSISDLLVYVRDTNDLNDLDRFYDRINTNLNRYWENLNEEFVNIVVQWMNNRQNMANV